ncbi:uncharacterized protein LOC111793042 [Cucurbita pepo subsp. pepo]|uniref:uncharacterized protein LOC111793042 n=1 Tax=Cucurbita pepo subsp. pepo TaxID=3664 RepID=UPI000C9D9BC9|nr:uncharacterized protein LOC111793042 [Cucurbita pepo subsp. pepo]
MEDRQSLTLPLLSAAPPTSANQSPFLSNQAIALRLLLVAFVGITSLLANHEASKGFDVTILNNAKPSPAGQRFHLFYVSNDEATRLILNASSFIENLIYPSQAFPKKPVKSVHLTLSRTDLSSSFAVEKLHDGGDDFVLHLSPSIFNEKDANRAMSVAVFRGMSRVWLWDGEAHAPPALLAGMVEHIMAAAGFVGEKYSGAVVSTLTAAWDPTWWKDKDPTEIAMFLDHQEKEREGFIQRLNQGLKARWHDRTVEEAVGVPTQHPCGSVN